MSQRPISYTLWALLPALSCTKKPVGISGAEPKSVNAEVPPGQNQASTSTTANPPPPIEQPSTSMAPSATSTGPTAETSLTGAPQPPGKDPGGKIPDIPPGKIPLEITITHLPSESWNDNCLHFGLSYTTSQGQTHRTPMYQAGCSKEPSVVGRKLVLPAEPGVCNIVRFQLTSFPPDRTNCPDNKPCGYFFKKPSVQRSSAVVDDWIGFFAYNVAKDLPINRYINLRSFQRDLNADFEEAQRLYPGGKNKGGWIRIFFEDQPSANIAKAYAYPSNKELHRKLGVDFNDAAVDVRASGVDFTLQNARQMRVPQKFVFNKELQKRVPVAPLGCVGAAIHPPKPTPKPKPHPNPPKGGYPPKFEEPKEPNVPPLNG